MPVTSPNAEKQRRVGDDGSLDLVVWCQDITESVASLTFMILDEEKKIQFQDLIGRYVYVEPAEAGKRQYRIVLPPRQVGIGSYILAVYSNSKPLKAFDIVRADNGFSNWKAKNSFDQLPVSQSGATLRVSPANLPVTAAPVTSTS